MNAPTIAPLRALLVLGTRDSLPHQTADGGLGNERWSPMMMLCWAICYADRFDGNPYYREATLLDAIRRLGDFNDRSADARGHFTNNIAGWDEWRLFAWMEAMERVRGDLDAARLDAWRRKFIGAAEHILGLCVDMEHFDGGIPNHGIWGHALLHRVGRLYDRRDCVAMADLAFDRILRSQTPDGCFREMQSAAGLQGSPVTGYNLVSLMAVNLYHAHGGAAAAGEALERGWRWWYDFALPNYRTPPCLDMRQVYGHNVQTTIAPCWPAWFFNQPEGRHIALQGWALRRAAPSAAAPGPGDWATMHSGPYSCQGLGFIALQYAQIEAHVAPRAPSWPDYRRMLAEEVCVRRRPPWTAVLSGMTNYDQSNGAVRLFALERQECLALYHQTLGLLIGSSHALMDERFSTFVFYENGAAYYLHNKAYLKSTPPLDTLHLRYGANIGALSVDTTQPECAAITFSLLGEQGKRPERGVGHPLSAMGAKAHLALRLQSGERVTVADGASRVLDETLIRLKIGAGQSVAFGRWSLTCMEAPWELHWPVRGKDPYHLLADGETLALAEVTVYTRTACLGYAGHGGAPRPTATFQVRTNG